MTIQTDLLRLNAQEALKHVDTKALDGKDVLLTGATGLIGVNLRAALDLSGAVRVTCPGHNLPTLGGEYDFIIHAAGYAQPAKFLSDPMSTIRVNTTMLMDLIGRLKPNGRLLFLSTSEVYSGHARNLHVEGDIGTVTPTHPRAAYIESKRCGEAICHAARAGKKTAIVARVSSVYGPGVRLNDTRVMSQFIDQAIRRGRIDMKDGGTARRVWLYASDCTEMLLNLLIHAQSAVYNVGGGAHNNAKYGYSPANMVGEVSILTLARKIAEILKVQVKTPKNSGLAEEGSPSHVGLDTGRYEREFGPKTFVPLDDGLRRTIEWHKAMVGIRGMVAA